MIDAIRDALDACTVLNLAYVDEDGPQVCAVFYAPTRDGDMVFVSSRSTRHGRALASDPDGVPVAFTVQDDDQSWRTLRGVQGRGVCRRLTGTDLDGAQAAYAARFPFVADDAQLARALAAADHWCVRPTWLRAIDNSRGFGHKTEWPGEG
ncbi:pyridoxamine 5'-phosphate oxidase family protein [Actinomadura sp. BRA 177]|uniref:pyridoxamine 5'-phosphate oxidase family protein n=1 Tax=Actinomadura sp. BRA 177 TaxID=2745202 RepID=UPI0015953344|nr:pyridoxamine 5'-phosphate oxidase family protein [Actinomadura sp. BRA 177]NVI87161.1 pyridoxamine 5'-phosphate oxidase family protein [Actinomadura sp. BRA 177]